MPTLRHPELPADQTYECLESQVEVFAASGWVLVEDDEPASKAKAGKPKPVAKPKPDAAVPTTNAGPALSGPAPDAAAGDVDTTPGTRR